MSAGRKSLVRIDPSAALVGKPFTPPTDVGALWTLFLRDKAEDTRRNYEWDLDSFARFLRTPTASDALQQLLACDRPGAHAMVLAFIGYLREQRFYRPSDDPKTAEPVQIGYAPSTINRRICALRAVVDLARLCGFITWELGQIKLPKAILVHDTSGPGPAGYGRILATLEEAIGEARRSLRSPGQHKKKQIRRRLEIALRDLVLVRLLYDTGLRRTEVTRITWPDDVILDAKPRVLVRGKGRTRSQWCCISITCVQVLEEYLEVRNQRRGYLLRAFGSDGSRRLNRTTINDRVDYWSQLAGVRTTPHGLRHTAITAALNKTDGSYRTVARWSRHEDPASLRHYDDARRQDERKLTEFLSDPHNAKSEDDDD